ncbi:MAG: substrate-binding domain-containing protein [Bryobacteraceae bacterium]
MDQKLNNKPSETTRKTDKYWVPIVAKTLDLLDCFGPGEEPLTLEEVVQRTGIPHTTAYRILHTLRSRDYLSQSGRQYRLNRVRKRLKLGFANLSKQISLAVEIERSLEKATDAAGIDLLVWDNDRNAEIAIRNAEAMAQSKVDIGIEFQLFEHVAPVIADIFSKSGTPLISIVNPHHGTLYFGVDNYRAGFSAGMALAEYASQRWGGRPDAVLLLESPRAGRTVQSRLIGVLRGIEERFGPLAQKSVEHLDGGGDKATSRSAVKSFLRRRPRKKVLIAGINDESAIGAAEALQQASGAGEAAVVGHGGSAEILEMICDAGSPCIGTVSFHAELYGPGLVSVVVPTLQGRSATPVHYVAHEFLGKQPSGRARKSR